jgi:hypothetical protein
MLIIWVVVLWRFPRRNEDELVEVDCIVALGIDFSESLREF